MTDLGGARVLVITPMRSELRPVVKAMNGKRGRLAETQVHLGRSGSAVVTAAMAGVGPDAARQATRNLVDAGRFDHVVVSGIAGGIGPGIEVGTLVTPAAVEDLSTGRSFIPRPVAGHRPQGVLATTAELILDDEVLASLHGRGIVALDMETAAVAEVCEERSLPWSVFRVVSDRPQDGLLDQGVFELLEADGTINLARAARYVAARPHRARSLVRLGRDAGGAARRAAHAAVSACAAL